MYIIQVYFSSSLLAGNKYKIYSLTIVVTFSPISKIKIYMYNITYYII